MPVSAKDDKIKYPKQTDIILQVEKLMGMGVVELARFFNTPYGTFKEWKAGRTKMPPVVLVTIRLLELLIEAKPDFKDGIAEYMKNLEIVDLLDARNEILTRLYDVPRQDRKKLLESLLDEYVSKEQREFLYQSAVVPDVLKEGEFHKLSEELEAGELVARRGDGRSIIAGLIWDYDQSDEDAPSQVIQPPGFYPVELEGEVVIEPEGDPLHKSLRGIRLGLRQLDGGTDLIDQLVGGRAVLTSSAKGLQIEIYGPETLEGDA